MAVTYDIDTKYDRMMGVATTLNAGAAPALEICSAGYAAVLVRVTLSAPAVTVDAVPPATSAIMRLNGTPLTATAIATGTPAVARLVRTSNESPGCVSGLTVGTAGTDIILDSATITAGQTVVISSGSITHG